MIYKMTEAGDLPLSLGDGYCVDMPSDDETLEAVGKYLLDRKAVVNLYAVRDGGKWHHMMHIAFPGKRYAEVEPIMTHLCAMVGASEFACIAGMSKSVVDADGDLIAWADPGD